MNSVRITSVLLPLVLIVSCVLNRATAENKLEPTTDNGKTFWLQKNDLSSGEHHQKHKEIFGKYVTGYNTYILDAIDKVQAHALDGGSYFIGVKAVPAESPVCYELKLFDKSLINPPRKASYCSGASYTAFIESLNSIYPDGASKLSDDRYESLRMQEPDGSRREDHIKFWGHWNADGFGNHFALVQYSGMGTEISPEQARPGDFLNIFWKTGNGHSVIFLGWYQDEKGEKNVVYWSSQPKTNGYGDIVTPISRISKVKVVRLKHPENLFTFDPSQKVKNNIPGSSIVLTSGTPVRE